MNITKSKINGGIHVLAQIVLQISNFSFLPGRYQHIVSLLLGIIGAIAAYSDQTLSKTGTPTP